MTKRSLRRLLVTAGSWSLAALGPLACRDRAAPAPEPEERSFFGQVQSSLEDLGGQPLIAASWSGEFRPYVFTGDGYRPLVVDRGGRLARVDLYRPTPLSADEILMTGQAAGRRAFDIYVLRLGDDAPVNLTATPDVDEGDLCVASGSRVLAYRAGDREVFARFARGRLEPIVSAPAMLGLRECVWLDAGHLVGVSGRVPPFHLTECRLGQSSVECHERQRAMENIVEVTDLTAGPGRGAGSAPGPKVAYLTALARDRPFRTVFALRAGEPGLDPIAPPEADSDLLDWSPGMWRTGRQGRYRSNLAPASPATIFLARRFGERVFAIAADPTTPRTLAVLEGAEWRLEPQPGHDAPSHVWPPRELWTESPRGERYQSFYFGPPAATRVVVWFHGGPRENVSPRFNPYFHALNRLGFAVVALNYPGSTGRGAAYEARFAEPGALDDALRSVWDHLRRHQVSTIVSWSVSAGRRLPRVLLEGRFPLSAIVDQAGFGNADLVAAAARSRVPVFSIRGRHDVYGPGTHVDFLYDGGHDITHYRDFAELFARVRTFLSSVGQVRWSGPGGLGP